MLFTGLFTRRNSEGFLSFFSFYLFFTVNESTSMEVGEPAGQEGGGSVLSGCHLACHHIRAKPHLHAWHVSDGSRTGSGYFSARQTLQDLLPRTKVIYDVINLSATLHSIYFWGWFIFSFPHFLSGTHSCPALSSPCWHLPTVTSNCPVVESSVAPKLLTQRQAPDDSRKYRLPPHSLSPLPRPVLPSLPPPFLSLDSPLWTPRECRTSAHVSACLWVCCHCASSCPLAITLPLPSVYSVPTIGPICLLLLLFLRGDLHFVAVRGVLTYFTPTLLFVAWPRDS